MGNAIVIGYIRIKLGRGKYLTIKLCLNSDGKELPNHWHCILYLLYCACTVTVGIVEALFCSSKVQSLTVKGEKVATPKSLASPSAANGSFSTKPSTVNQNTLRLLYAFKVKGSGLQKFDTALGFSKGSNLIR